MFALNSKLFKKENRTYNPYRDKLEKMSIPAKIIDTLEDIFKTEKFSYLDLDIRVLFLLQYVNPVHVHDVSDLLKNLNLDNHVQRIRIEMFDKIQPYSYCDLGDLKKVPPSAKPKGDLFGPRWHLIDELVMLEKGTLEITTTYRAFGVSPHLLLPGQDCTIICNNLPFDSYEDEVFLLFETFGKVHSVEILMNEEKNETSGVATITYATKEEASTAIEKMNGYEIRKNQRIEVRKFNHKANFILYDITSSTTQTDVIKRMGPLLGNKINPRKCVTFYKYGGNKGLVPATPRNFALVKLFNEHTIVMPANIGKKWEDEGFVVLRSSVMSPRDCQNLHPGLQIRFCVLKMLEKIDQLKTMIESKKKVTSQEKISAASSESFHNYAYHSYVIEEGTADNEGIQSIKEMTSELSSKHLTEKELKNMNATLGVRECGDYRKSHVGIFLHGEWSHGTPPEKIAEEMDQLFSSLSTKTPSSTNSTIISAATFCLEYLRIHPFSDGNGRISRAIFNVMLRKSDFPAYVRFPVERSTQYYESLKIAHKTGNKSLFYKYTCEIVMESLQHYLSLL
ncbi:protein adenylyltransferase Fic-like [Planococcus citri]|uniref:protein adenylyltransferase Fic-like n=1 Tax=Planococcus citri TaxID=170843 RepID=UPI0031F8C428